MTSTPLEPPYDIVALASSAGGIAALGAVLSGLPDDFPVPVVLVQHLDPRHRSLLTDILDRQTKLHVREARQDDPIEPTNVYIAPPNRHFLISTEKTVMLVDSELVHFVRPSADLLFESMAACCKEKSIAVILTGTGMDGSMGVVAVKKMGGTVIAQDQKSAEFFGMPGAAIETGSVDFVLPLEEIAPALIKLVYGEAP